MFVAPVRHIRANADEYGIDANRIGVYGASAGGHLSLMLGLASDEGDAEDADPINQVSNRGQRGCCLPFRLSI